MLKWLLGLLLAVNLVFLAYMQWGGAATGESSITQSRPTLNAEKIKLVKLPASSPVVTLPAVPPVASSPAAQPAAVPPPTQALACMRWGEFSGNDLGRATEALTALKLGDRVVQHQTEHNGGYWVFLPPQASRADVDRKISELKTLGVTDYFVVQDSKQWMNAISLGIFKTGDAARKFLDNMKARGVRSAEMGERFSKLKFTVFDLNNLDAALSNRITALQKQFADSELKVIPCPGAIAN